MKTSGGEFALAKPMRSIGRQIFFTLVLLASGPRFSYAECDLLLISEPVAGLYESLPKTLDLQVGDHHITTQVIDSGDRSGEIALLSTLLSAQKKVLALAERHFSVDRRKMTLWNLQTKNIQTSTKTPTFLDVPETVPMVPGRGTPTSVLLTLLQMRLVGVSYGELQTITTGPIHNTQTLFELRHRPIIAQWMNAHRGQPPPSELIAAEIFTTNTGRYIQTTLTQAGLRVVDVKVFGGATQTVLQLLELSWALGHPIRARGSLAETEYVPDGFYLSLKVAPI